MTTRPTYSTEYWHLDAGAVVGIYDFGVGWEVLGGDDSTVLNEAFQTPLATLHAFQGWADVFLSTPAAGIDDKYLKFKVTPGDFVIDAGTTTSMRIPVAPATAMKSICRSATNSTSVFAVICSLPTSVVRAAIRTSPSSG